MSKVGRISWITQQLVAPICHQPTERQSDRAYESRDREVGSLLGRDLWLPQFKSKSRKQQIHQYIEKAIQRNDMMDNVARNCRTWHRRCDIAEPVTLRTRYSDRVIRQLSVQDVVILRVEVRHAPTPTASVVPEIMRQLEDPTSPRASCVLEECAARFCPRFTLTGEDGVCDACNLLPVREPSIGVNGLDRARRLRG